MKLKKNSITTKVWLYLTLFSISILAFLWIFQVVFLNKYYEFSKTSEITAIGDTIIKNYNTNSNNFYTFLDQLAYEKAVCIEIVNSNNLTFYSTNNFDRNCIGDTSSNRQLLLYRQSFFQSQKLRDNVIIINPRFKNKTLVSAIRMNNEYALFINSSIEPIDSTAIILKSQFLYVTIIVFALSFLIAYFISRKLSNPIIKISNAAKQMTNGQYDVVLDDEENIDEICELNNNLKMTCQELAKTESLRRELMANVSHDLKTPLTMIKAYAEMVRDLTYKDDEKRNNNLNVIIDEANRLNLLVNDILDLSSMQSQTVKLNFEEVDLVTLVNAIVHRFDILKETEGYNFIVEVPDKAIVKAELKRMEQVIYNLVSNAINYTGEDKVVKVIIKELDKVYRVEVIDTGKGINDEDMPYIWDKYYKVDKKYQRSHYGTGLGLSIVKNILVLHHCNYGVISKKKKGTTFYFEIPKIKSKNNRYFLVKKKENLAEPKEKK